MASVDVESKDNNIIVVPEDAKQQITERFLAEARSLRDQAQKSVQHRADLLAEADRQAGITQQLNGAFQEVVASARRFGVELLPLIDQAATPEA